LTFHEREQITVPPDGRPLDVQPAWRQDFPIDSPLDQYIERREFMKFMVLTSLAFTVGQFWIAAQHWWRRRHNPNAATRVASLDDIPVGAVRTFSYPTEHDPCVLVRSDDKTLVAYSQRCTHLSCAVVPHVEDNSILCPCHEGRFDLATGRPVAGPPRRPLSLVHLEMRGREIYATGVEDRTV
jgi:Rieske Fe-S protein